MAVFGIPVVHEDDALRAVRAAAEMRERLAGSNDDLERDWGGPNRRATGVNTGEVVAGDAAGSQRSAAGDVNVAKRFEEAAPRARSSSATRRTACARRGRGRTLEPLSLKGKSEQVAAYRLVGLAGDAPGRARRLDSPMVGRGRELAALEQAYRAVEERMPPLHRLGAAGVGKSRLVTEFSLGSAPRRPCCGGRCLPYGEDHILAAGRGARWTPRR